MNITKKVFGRFWNSEVTSYTLENPGGVAVTILDYGAIIQSLSVPGHTGYDDIVLGFDTLYDYLKGHPFFGSIAGRVANRIPQGRFAIDGTDYQLSVNAPFDNHLHGGFRGFDKYVWHSEPFEDGDRVGLRLHRISPDGEEGYPGTLDTTIIYWLDSDNVLGFEVRAATDQPTIVNIVQHSYLNLAGHDSGTVTGQELSIAADQVTPTDERLRPTGAITSVVDTIFDLRAPTQLKTAFEKAGGVFDINYVLDPEAAGMKPCARMHDPASGRTLTIATTQPGVQFYNAHKLSKLELVGKGGHRYPDWAGICLETQAFPNAVNHHNFPSMVVRPQELYHHKTTYAFSIE